MLPWLIFAFWLGILSQPVAAAGFSDGLSAADAPPSFDVAQIVKFSKKIEQTLAAHGARVALVARMGRMPAELPEGMRYTHVGFAVYSEITTHDGRKLPGYAMFNLYQNNDHPDRSALVQDYPVDFFASSVQLESGILIPSPELQRRLLAVIGTPTYNKLHDPHYSAIANPYTQGRQNCTEFVLDVVHAAIYQTDDIRQIKANERGYFQAQRIKISPLRLMLGAMLSTEISLSDQPDIPVTATFETIATYLKRYDAGSELLTVLPDPSQ